MIKTVMRRMKSHHLHLQNQTMIQHLNLVKARLKVVMKTIVLGLILMMEVQSMLRSQKSLLPTQRISKRKKT